MTSAATTSADMTSATDLGGVTPAVWERTVTALAAGQPTDRDAAGLAAALAGDPGMAVLSELVTTARAGGVSDLLPLTCRLVLLTAGEQRLLELFRSYWSVAPPEPFGADEVRGLGRHLLGLDTGVPHLAEVLAFELASHEVYLTGAPASVRFTCAPMPLLEALGQGVLPEHLEPGEYVVEVTP
jgi:uncharacterized protein